jgi:hypothetical protein
MRFNLKNIVFSFVLISGVSDLVGCKTIKENFPENTPEKEAHKVCREFKHKMISNSYNFIPLILKLRVQSSEDISCYHHPFDGKWIGSYLFAKRNESRLFRLLKNSRNNIDAKKLCDMDLNGDSIITDYDLDVFEYITNYRNRKIMKKLGIKKSEDIENLPCGYKSSPKNAKLIREKLNELFQKGSISLNSVCSLMEKIDTEKDYLFTNQETETFIKDKN